MYRTAKVEIDFELDYETAGTDILHQTMTLSLREMKLEENTQKAQSTSRKNKNQNGRLVRTRAKEPSSFGSLRVGVLLPHHSSVFVPKD